MRSFASSRVDLRWDLQSSGRRQNPMRRIGLSPVCECDNLVLKMRFETSWAVLQAIVVFGAPSCNAQTDRPVPSAEIITPDAKSQTGVFKVHQVAGKLYYEIPRNELEQPFLWLTRVASGSGM